MKFHCGRMPDIPFATRALSFPGGIIHIALAIIMLVATAPAFAQRSIPLTLAETEQLALAAEPGQRALRYRAAAMADRAVEATTLPDPMLRIGLNNYPLESGGVTTAGMSTAGVAYRQAFPAGKTRSINAKQYEWRAAEINENAEERGRQVLMSARIAWLDAYFLDRTHELITETRPFFDDLASITRSLYSVGSKDQQDVLWAELELSRIDDKLIEIERQQAQARAMLGEWIGDDSARPIADKLPAWDNPPALYDLQEGMANHPALLAADARIAARDAGVELADQRSRPEWALDVAYSYRNGSLPSGDPRSDFITVGVTVGLPFFRRKSVDSTLSAALQERSAARQSKSRLLRELQSKLEAEYARYQELARRLVLYEEQILEQAGSTAEAALLAYQSDRGDFADVMRGYISDLNTRIEYIRLQVERAESFAVLANLGGMTR
mgnify:CR=1 FL=1